MSRDPKHFLALGLLLAFSTLPMKAEADVRDELFQVTILFEQAYQGFILLDGTDLKVGTNATLGASLRVELLLSQWVGLGVEGSASYFRAGSEGIVPGSESIFDDDRHLIAGTNGFLRLRFGLGSGLGEYYFIGGGGPAYLDYDENDPNAFGPGLGGNSELGWTAYARFGVRGELTPGFGGVVEIGWIHREHSDALERTDAATGTATVYDYVVNQLSITFGWYLTR